MSFFVASAMSGKSSNLLHETKEVGRGPIFDHLAIDKVQDADPCPCDLLSRWGNLPKRPCMGRAVSRTNHDLLPLSDEIFNGDMQIRKGGQGLNSILPSLLEGVGPSTRTVVKETG